MGVQLNAQFIVDRNFSYDLFIGETTKLPDHFQTEPTVSGFSLNTQF